MSLDLDRFAIYVSWGASGFGLGLFAWSFIRESDAIRRLRFQDFGVVLLFGSVLLRVVAQERPMTVFDWAWVLLSPLFIAAALWRLDRTSDLPGPGKR
ncbi:MAG: hypothetical protein ACOH1H_03845 [Brevundimonas sp.]|jgi:hypothetical protein